MQTPDMYSADRRYIFTNWSVEDFTGYVDKNPETIKAGEIKELGEFKAYHYCKHFVDREMGRDGKSTLLGIDTARKEYEDKTITPITGSTESPALASLKEKIRQEVEQENDEPEVVEKKKAGRPKKEMKSSDVGEFADLA